MPEKLTMNTVDYFLRLIFSYFDYTTHTEAFKYAVIAISSVTGFI